LYRNAPRHEKQQFLKERIYSIESRPDEGVRGLKLSLGQVLEAKKKIKEIFN
jgi:hypothetical protein